MPKNPYGSTGPSKRHQFTPVGSHGRGGRVTIERCLRCGSHFTGYGRAAFYCHPKADWLAEHPDDDGETY